MPAGASQPAGPGNDGLNRRAVVGVAESVGRVGRRLERSDIELEATAEPVDLRLILADHHDGGRLSEAEQQTDSKSCISHFINTP